MYSNQLLTGESIITQSDNNQITLTTHRIRYNVSATGSAKIVSILLENVSSIEVRYKSWIIMLYLGLLTGVAGAVTSISGMNNQISDVQSLGFCLLAVAGVFILVYYLSRQHIVSIASNGGASIDFYTKGLNRESIINLIDKVEDAIHQRNNSFTPATSF